MRRRLRKGAINDLIDGVNRLPFAGAAAQDKDPRDQLKLRLVRLRPSMSFIILTQNDTGNANRLTAVAAKNTAERLRGRINRHGKDSLEVQTGCEALAGYRKAPRSVHPKIKRWVVEKSDASRQEQSDNKYLFLFDIKTLGRRKADGRAEAS